MNGFSKLSRELQRIIKREGYVKPTPIQDKTIPYILSRKSVIVVSPTGSGKTEAALFPLFDLMLRDLNRQKEKPFLAYITPLRALNRDILHRMEAISEKIGLKVSAKHGDTSVSQRREFVRNTPHWFITTPESFIYMMSNEKLGPILSNIRYIVVDEMHEIVDTKRGASLSLALARLSKRAKSNLQFIGLSATIREDDEEKYRKFYPYEDVAIIRDTTLKKIQINVQTTLKPDRKEKKNLWLDEVALIIKTYVDKSRPILVFTNTRDTAEILGNVLRDRYGMKVSVHHGSLSKGIREDVEKALKRGELEAVIATSSLELGIDIGTMELVIQVSSPRQVTRMLQRVGRSGHRLEKTSRSVIISEPSLDDTLESLVIARRSERRNIERITIPAKPLDVLLHSLVGEVILQKNGIELKEFYDLVKKTIYYNTLSFEELEKVVEHGSSIGVLRKEGSKVLRSKRSKSYFFSTSMIVESRKVKTLSTENKLIGYLDEEFVISSLDVGDTLILAGALWKVLSIDDDKVVVTRISGEPGIPPKWEGELIPVSVEVAQETCNLISVLVRLAKDEANTGYFEKYKDIFKQLDRESLTHVMTYARKINNVETPSPSYILIEKDKQGKLVVIYTCLGTRANNMLSILLSFVLSKVSGTRTASSSDAYRVILYSPYSNVYENLKALVGFLRGKDSSYIRDLAVEAVRESSLFMYYLAQVSKRMGLFSQDAPLSSIKKMLKYIKDTIVGEEALQEIFSTKVDFDRSLRFIKNFIENEKKIIVNNSISELTMNSRVFSKAYVSSLNGVIPTGMLLDLFIRRLEEKKTRLICLSCGSEKVVKIKEIADKPSCSRCGSKAVIPLPDSNVEFIQVVRELVRNPMKKFRGKKKEYAIEARRRANLVLTYGKPAIIALSAYGVGPKAASKALSKLKLGERKFFEELYLREQDYIRTRKFWDD